ncbi:MAG: CstA-like transporter-associated (seleno)protein [Galactobacter sp.]
MARTVQRLTAVRDYLEGLLGGGQYKNYLAWHARTQQGETPMTEREYWKHRHAHEDANPEGRCC